ALTACVLLHFSPNRTTIRTESRKRLIIFIASLCKKLYTATIFETARPHCQKAGEAPMLKSRRTFVKAGLMTALFAATPLRSAFAKGFKYLIDEDDPLANYSKATFVSYLNSVFQIQTAS